ncbi:MAG: hydrogenase [Sporomusa sp.]
MDWLVSTGLLISTLLLFKIKKVSDAVGIIAFQSLLLVIVAIIMWHRTGIAHLLVAAGLIFAVKTMFIPAILYYTLGKIDAKKMIKRSYSPHMSLLLATVLLVVGYYVSAELQLPSTFYGKYYLPTSIIVILLGTFIMIEHKEAIMQGLGLIVIENGIFLITQSVSYGMPIIVELGILFGLLVSAVVIAGLAFRIHWAFASLNTDKMQNLKG